MMKGSNVFRVRARAVQLCVLVVLGGLAPVVGATHANEVLNPPVPQPWEDLEKSPTGIDLLDAALRIAAGAIDDVADQVESSLPSRAEPQVPATFFHDRFGSDRIGGWGSWAVQNPSNWIGKTWHVNASGAGRSATPHWNASTPAPSVQQTCPPSPPSDGGANPFPCVPAAKPVEGQPVPPASNRSGVENGYRFGDEIGYPIDVDRKQFRLVSPVISLRSLPVSVQDAGNVPGLLSTLMADSEGAVDLAPLLGATTGMLDAAAAPSGGTQPATSERIVLYFDHKYHFAYSEPVRELWPCPTMTISDVNSVRCNLGLNRVTKLVDHHLDGGRVYVLPEGAPFPSGLQLLMPMEGAYPQRDQSCYQQSGGTNPPCQAPAMPFRGFSGARMNFSEVAFDLTPWAGRNVHVVFEASTNFSRLQGAARDETHFTDSRYFLTDFQGTDPFYGWAISNVRVEGPALFHNVRLDRVVEHPLPNRTRTDSAPYRDGEFVASASAAALHVLALNRGRVTEDVDASLTATWMVQDDAGATTRTAVCVASPVRLRPGEAKAVPVPLKGGACTVENQQEDLQIAAGTDYNVTFRIGLADPNRVDLYSSDNTMRIRVKGEAADFVFRGRPSTPQHNPPLVGKDVTVPVSVPVLNRGASAGTAELHLRIDWLQMGSETWELNQQENSSLVEVAPQAGLQPNLTRKVHIPARSEMNVGWDIAPKQPGLYKVSVALHTNRGWLTESVIIGVLDAPKFAYSTNFITSQDDGQTLVNVADWATPSGWTSRSVLNASPPCPISEETCGGIVWELNQTTEDGASDTRMTVLRGEFSVAEHERNVQINQIQVSILHYAMNVRCRPTYVGQQPIALLQCNMPHDNLSVRLVDGVPTGLGGTVGGSFFGGPPAVTGSAAAPTTELRPFIVTTVGGDHYRNAYYAGQWLEERFTVNVTDLLATSHNLTTVTPGSTTLQVPGEGSLAATDGTPLLQSVPAGRLAEYALEFVMLGRCPASSEDPVCPTWRLRQAKVDGIGVDGTTRLSFVDWDGSVPSQGSQLFSYRYRELPTRYNCPGGSCGLVPSASQLRQDPTTYPSTQYLPNNYPYTYVQETPDRLGNFSSTMCQESGAQQGFTCASGWRMTPVENLVPPSSSWVLHDALGWTSSGALDPTTGQRFYSEVPGGRVDLLESPIVRVPAVSQPQVSFDHRFQFHPYHDPLVLYARMVNSSSVRERDAWQNPSFGDSGLLMVKFYDEQGQETTPYLPVRLFPNRFMRSDCQNHYTSNATGNPLHHPDREKLNQCHDRLLQRSAVTQRINLSNVTIMDYRSPGVGLPPSNASLPAAVPVDMRTCIRGLPTPVRSPLDPTPDGARPCNVRFAFRLEIPDDRVLGTHASGRALIEEAKSLSRKTDSGRLDAEGWYIHGFRLLKDQATAFDLSLLDVNVSTGYDWVNLSLGPNGTATAQFTVQSLGVFPTEGFTFTTYIWDATEATDQPIVHTVQPGADFRIPEKGGKASINLTFPLPATTKAYQFAFSVDLPDDQNPKNDCLFLQRNGKATVSDRGRDPTTGHCLRPLAGAHALPVAARPNLLVDVSVNPMVGLTDKNFPRQVDLTVTNRGNVPVRPAVLTLAVERAGASEAPQLSRWLIHTSPGPGQNASWSDMVLLRGSLVSPGGQAGGFTWDQQALAACMHAPHLTEGCTAAKQDTILLPEQGLYFITASIQELTPVGTQGGEIFDRIVLQSYKAIYADTFAPDGVRTDFDFVVSGQVERQHESWRVTESTGITGARSSMWGFGDPLTGKYGNRADASLLLPRFDLSSAQRASFIMTHNYSLERGYDGGIVEASLDDGISWIPLHPTRARAYTNVSAENPLNPDDDPTRTTVAFTGSSNWIIDEFNLAQLPGFTTPTVLERFTLSHISGGPHGESTYQRLESAPRITWHEDWFLPGERTLEQSWLRENMQVLNPPPLCAAHPSSGSCANRTDYRYWWSGNVGRANLPTGGNAPGTRLQVEFTANLSRPEMVPFLEFWYWKDQGGNLGVADDRAPKSGTGHERKPIERVEVFGGATNGWMRGQLRLEQPEPGATNRTYTIRFDYTSTDANVPSRGGVIDGLQVRWYRMDPVMAWAPTEVVMPLAESTGVVISSTVIRGTPTLHPWHESSGTPSWTAVNDTGYCANHPAFCQGGKSRLNWTAVAAVPAADEVWGIDQAQQTRRGEVGPVWRFGVINASDPLDRFTYPPNAHERLVTPFVSLAKVGGDSATLVFWEKYDLMRSDTRRILVQPLVPTPNKPEGEPGEWQVLWSRSSGSRLHSFGTGATPCTGTVDVRGGTGFSAHDAKSTFGWCPAFLDLSPFIGETVRFAFEVVTTRMIDDVMATNPPSPTGFTWMLDEVGVEATSIVGQPVMLRMRAGTDVSIDHGHWLVDSVQLVGFQYENNFALVPSEPIVDREVAVGGFLDLHGTVRNLGYALKNVYLEIVVAPVDPSAGLPPAVVETLDDDGPDLMQSGPTSRMGPFQLNVAGATGDRFDYAVRIAFPPVNGQQYRIDVRLLDENMLLLTDENQGDHARSAVVTLKDVPLLSASIAAIPPTIELNETAKFALHLENLGNVPLSMGERSLTVIAQQLWSPLSTVVNSQPVEILNLSLALPEPGAALVHQLEAEFDRPGYYRITASVKPIGINLDPIVTHVLVGAKPIYVVENFSADPFAAGDGSWTRSPTPCAATDVACWRRSPTFRVHGTNSLFIGSESPSGTYPARARAQASTPWINLTWLAPDDIVDRAILNGESPFSPYVSVLYQSLMADGKVELRVAKENFKDNAYHTLRTRGALPDHQGDWRYASFPLFHEDPCSVIRIPKPGGVECHDVMGARNLSFQFDFQAGNTPGQAFAIDVMTVSSYGVKVFPPRYDVALEAGSDKTYYFRVENSGAAEDVFTVRLAEGGSLNLLNPQLARVEVVPSQMKLVPGEAKLVAVHVVIPSDEGPDFSGEQLELLIESATDPSRVATAVISVDFEPPRLPDLVTRLRRPAGDGGPAVVGTETTFAITVENGGRAAAAATDLMIFACPSRTASGAPVDSVEMCRRLRSEGQLDVIPLGKLRLPPLREGTAVHRTVSWVPKEADAGSFRIIAVADPEHIVRQIRPETAVASLLLDVVPPTVPDLQVSEFKLMDVLGNPISRAVVGDVVRVEGTVVNRGIAPAKDVSLRIVNQFPLREERLAELRPGQEVQLTAQWIAEAGNWVFLLESAMRGLELDKSNNVAQSSLAVQPGALAARWRTPVLHLEPGGSMVVDLALRNGRAAAVDVVLESPPGDVMVDRAPVGVAVPRGGSAEVPLAVAASPFAAPGHHLVVVSVLERGSQQVLAEAKLDVYIGAQRGIELSYQPVLTPPGAVKLPLSFTNTGSAPEVLELAVVPQAEDWTVTILQPTVLIEPGATRVVPLTLDVPLSSPAGRHHIDVRWASGGQDIAVDVTPQPVWMVDVVESHASADGASALISVMNAGNSPGVPPFVLRAEGQRPAAPYAIAPVPAVHEPGQRVLYHVSSRAPAEHLALTLPDGGPLVLAAETETSRVTALGFSLEKPGAVQVGDLVDFRLEVQSESRVLRGVPVRLWVDGSLRAEVRVDLVPGESQTVTMHWKVDEAKLHLVTATVGAGEEALVQTLLVSAVLPSPAAIPGAGWLWLFVGIAVATAVRVRLGGRKDW